MKTNHRIFLVIAILANVSCSKESPEAAFIYEPGSPYAGDTVFFTNQSNFANKYEWTFGDGANSEESSPFHIYNEEGAYAVNLVASNSEGSDTHGETISVRPAFEQFSQVPVKAYVSKATAVSVDTADIDGDGDLDIVVPLFSFNQLVWYENLGTSWTPHTISSSAYGVTFAFCTDVDQDNRPDVLAVLYQTKQILLYLNKAAGWETVIIDGAADNPDYFVLVDMNADEKLDILPASSSVLGGDIVWYENQHPTWNRHIIEEGSSKYVQVVPDDYDGDGLIDVAATMNGLGKVVLFKNESGGTSWTKTTIDDALPNAFALWSGDLNGDNVPDLVAGDGGPYYPGHSVYWYENNYPNWVKHEIDNNLNKPTYFLIHDMDGDNVNDIIVSSYSEDALLWYDNSNAWEKNYISRSIDGPRLFLIYDINSDGLDDFLVAGEYDVSWLVQNEKEY